MENFGVVKANNTAPLQLALANGIDASRLSTKVEHMQQSSNVHCPCALLQVE